MNWLLKIRNKIFPARKNEKPSGNDLLQALLDAGVTEGATIIEPEIDCWDETIKTMEAQAAAATEGTTVKLVLDCYACPEQYDAFIGEKQVGYLRLRHGVFTVECPDSGAKRVLEARPSGDGIFYDDERHHYLKLAVAAILAHIEGSTPDQSSPLADRAAPAPDAKYTVEPKNLDDGN